MNIKKQPTKIKEEAKTDVDLAKMESMSGEKDLKSAPKYALPSLKLNGKKGKFYRTNLDDGILVIGEDGKAELEEVKEPAGAILKVRKTYMADEAEYQLYSNEVGNGANEQVSIFEKRETAKGFAIGFIFKGTPAEVKARFPEISMIQIVYFMMVRTGEVVRLKVKGMSLGQLFAYWKDFEAKEHVFEFITQLGVKPDKNKYGEFFVNTFKKGVRISALQLSKISLAMEDVCEKIKTIEDFYADKEYEPVDQEIKVEDKAEKDKPLEPDTPEEKAHIPWKETKEPTEQEINEMFGE